MNCPNCNNELSENVVHGIALDECIACGSFWFDAGELEDYLTARLKDKKEKLSLLSNFEAVGNGYDELCPKCTKTKLVYGKVGQLALSKCGKCNGFFIEKSQITAGRSSSCEPLAEALLIQLVGETVLNLLDGL